MKFELNSIFMIEVHIEEKIILIDC